MKNLFFFTLLTVNISFAQELTLVVPLVDSIQETSGLIYLNQTLITHNDSGNEPYLYEIDPLTGAVLKATFIDNSSNTDWEDLTFDDNYIYISDFGNNTGARTDLKVYRVSRAAYFSSSNDTIVADTISFSYADQIDFTPSNFSTNFDAEAIISMGDSLYLFTKNWSDGTCNIYALSKIPGNYSIPKIDSVNSLGLVTGATYANNSIFLSGYTFAAPFLIEISNFSGSNISLGDIEHYTVSTPSGNSFQIEGITAFNSNEYYISAENASSGTSSLYKFHIDSLLGLDNITSSKVLFYPNPATDILYFTPSIEEVFLYSSKGKLLYQTKKNKLQISALKAGVYLLKIGFKGEVFTEKLVVK